MKNSLRVFLKIIVLLSSSFCFAEKVIIEVGQPLTQKQAYALYSNAMYYKQQLGAYLLNHPEERTPPDNKLAQELSRYTQLLDQGGNMGQFFKTKLIVLDTYPTDQRKLIDIEYRYPARTKGPSQVSALISQWQTNQEQFYSKTIKQLRPLINKFTEYLNELGSLEPWINKANGSLSAATTDLYKSHMMTVFLGYLAPLYLYFENFKEPAMQLPRRGAVSTDIISQEPFSEYSLHEMWKDPAIRSAFLSDIILAASFYPPARIDQEFKFYPRHGSIYSNGKKIIEGRNPELIRFYQLLYENNLLPHQGTSHNLKSQLFLLSDSNLIETAKRLKVPSQYLPHIFSLMQAGEISLNKSFADAMNPTHSSCRKKLNP